MSHGEMRGNSRKFGSVRNRAGLLKTRHSIRHSRIDRQKKAARLGSISTLSEMFRAYMGTADSLWSDRGVRLHTLQFLRTAYARPVI